MLKADCGDTVTIQEKEQLGEEEGADDISMDDLDLETLRARVKEMEEEVEKIRQMQSEVEKQMNMSTSSGSALNISLEEKMEVDNCSIYVGNVNYDVTAEQLDIRFYGCGSINQGTILCNKFTGHPKGDISLLNERDEELSELESDTGLSENDIQDDESASAGIGRPSSSMKKKLNIKLTRLRKD